MFKKQDYIVPLRNLDEMGQPIVCLDTIPHFSNASDEMGQPIVSLDAIPYF